MKTSFSNIQIEFSRIFGFFENKFQEHTTQVFKDFWIFENKIQQSLQLVNSLLTMPPGEIGLTFAPVVKTRKPNSTVRADNCGCIRLSWGGGGGVMLSRPGLLKTEFPEALVKADFVWSPQIPYVPLWEWDGCIWVLS